MYLPKYLIVDEMNLSDQNNGNKFQPRTKLDRFLDLGFIWVTKIMGMATAAVLAWIVFVVFIQAMPAISHYGVGFLFNSDWAPNQDMYGVLPQIYGTLASALIALVIAVPIGLGVALFLSEDYLPPKVQTALVFFIELLAAIPSVVYGLWGIFVIIPFLKQFTPLNGPGLLPAGMILAIMVLPTIASLSRDALTSLPPDLRQAALGLGATRWEAIIQVLIPAAFSGIVGAIMLALGRALGETMAVTMLIGNSNKIELSLFAPSNTIASLLANQFAEASGLQVAALMYAALILFVLTLLINVGAELLVRQVQHKV